MASDLAAKGCDNVDCSARHVHDYALSMLRSAGAEVRALPSGDALPISLFLERERENKHVSQQIFNKVRSARWIKHFLERHESHLCRASLFLFRLSSTRAR